MWVRIRTRDMAKHGIWVRVIARDKIWIRVEPRDRIELG